MGGLGLGSYVFGRRAAGLSDPIRTYGLLEVGIGLYCALTPGLFWLASRLYLHLHATLTASYEAFSFVQFVLVFVVLLVPTALMGATLPVLVQGLVRSETGHLANGRRPLRREHLRGGGGCRARRVSAPARVGQPDRALDRGGVERRDRSRGDQVRRRVDASAHGRRAHPLVRRATGRAAVVEPRDVSRAAGSPAHRDGARRLGRGLHGLRGRVDTGAGPRDRQFDLRVLGDARGLPHRHLPAAPPPTRTSGEHAAPARPPSPRFRSASVSAWRSSCSSSNACRTCSSWRCSTRSPRHSCRACRSW